MIDTSIFTKYLESTFPQITFYSGYKSKKPVQCVGVYPINDDSPPRIAIGGIQNTSFAVYPVSLLIHWSESLERCEKVANDLYAHFFGNNNLVIGTTRVIQAKMMCPSPIDLNRDDENICEMTIRMQIFYER